MPRQFWTPDEDDVVRSRYGQEPVASLADSLGRTVKAVYQRAESLGLTRAYAGRLPGLEEFVAAKHAEGWSDAEVARERGCERHTVGDARVRLGLPPNAGAKGCHWSDRQRERVRRRTAEQLEVAGLSSLGALRSAVWAGRVAAAGWPADLPPRQAQILDMLHARGPMTRRELCDALGLPWRGTRKSLQNKKNSHLAELIARGLVVCLGKIERGKGKGCSTNRYALPLWVTRGEVSGGE